MIDDSYTLSYDISFQKKGAAKLGSHNNLTESFKVTTSETDGAPTIGYVGRSYDALYQTGLYIWTDRYATVRIPHLFFNKILIFPSSFHLPSSSSFQLPPSFFLL